MKQQRITFSCHEVVRILTEEAFKRLDINRDTAKGTIQIDAFWRVDVSDATKNEVNLVITDTEK